MSADKFAEAIPVWQDYAKAHPDDVEGPVNLGGCLAHEKKYSEAATAYEAAVKIKPEQPNLQMSLGSAYLQAGERDKASAAFAKIADLDPNGDYFNNIAYTLAESDLDLPLALDYSKKAVLKAEESTQKITLPGLKNEELQKIFMLSAYWDTLGWVNEHTSNLQAAEQYLKGAWMLTEDGVVAGHLCHLYRQAHQTAMGIQMCSVALNRLSLSQQPPLSSYKTEMDAAKENLDYPTKESAKAVSVDPTDFVLRERTFKLATFLPGTESAEFFVLLASDGKSRKFKVEDVKFISGSSKMRLQGNQLRKIDFSFAAPDTTPTRFVRRGILGCYKYTGCSFVLLDPGSVQSN